MLIHIESIEQYKENINNGLVLVDFYASWCGPCRMLTPLLEEIAEEDEDLTILKVDCDEFGQIAQNYGVSAIPALFLFKNGELIKENVGFLPKPQLIAFIAQGK